MQAREPLGMGVYPEDRLEVWFRNAVAGPDQLRQRMAFALSEIMVTSDVSTALEFEPMMLAAYYDILAKNALGNFRKLIEDVTLSQAMGHYLSMLGNRKPDPANGIRSDENFAREIMQLFTVGLDQLNPDGSVKRDGNGQPLPTYTQSDIANLARLFTGWSYPGTQSNDFFFPATTPAPGQPMRVYPEFHDTSAKTIIGGTLIPAGQTPEQDLAQALETLFQHPNVGPFIGRQLIQRLVTSNPSPAYVARVTQVFNNNGSGVRGDLYAVARAILLDIEARNGHVSNPASFGKLREPLLRVTHLWRAFGAASRSGRFIYSNPEADLAQAPLRSPSVFNFFRPRYQPAGALAAAGLVGPEFQITNESTVTSVGNTLDYFAAAYRVGSGFSPRYVRDDDVYLDYRPWETRAGDVSGLVSDIDVVFLSGQMPDAMRQTLLNYLAPVSDRGERIYDALNLTLGSAQYAIQR